MSTSSARTRRVTVVGGGLVGLSTAIIIQENVPNVHVELLDDFGFTTTLLSRANSKAMKGFRTSSPSEKIGNRSAEILSNMGPRADDEGQSFVADVIKDGLNVGAAALLTQELSSTRSTSRVWSSDDDVIWMPQSVPGLDDDTTGRGGYYRFWAVLTWYHLYELMQKESSYRTGVRLLSDYILHQWKDKQVSDWWKDLVPDFTPLHNEFHEDDDQSTSGPLRYGVSFTTAVINVPRYVQYLTERFLRYGGGITRGQISSINELPGPCELLVNCSGMNTDQRLSDKAELPEVQAQQLSLTPSMQASNCLKPCLHVSERGRLETDTVTHKGRPLPVVHNYGYDQNHLATLHWGCAQEAARLVSDILAGRFIGTTSKL
eukprot:XP_003727189.1 PREDICTED: D-aspartate oxidase isoform X2 [Strongylocentrotus purpuratus]